MYGIEAINQAEGWSLAALGILVVFSSLVVLSIIISQLHKALDALEGWKKTLGSKLAAKPAPEDIRQQAIDEETTKFLESREVIPQPDVCLENIHTISASYEPLVEKTGDPFRLSDLYNAASESGFPHPHLTITCLRWANIIVPADNQMFTFRRAPD